MDHGMLTSYLRVEMYLTVKLKLAKYPEVEKTQVKMFSKQDTLGKWTPFIKFVGIVAQF